VARHSLIRMLLSSVSDGTFSAVCTRCRRSCLHRWAVGPTESGHCSTPVCMARRRLAAISPDHSSGGVATSLVVGPAFLFPLLAWIGARSDLTAYLVATSARICETDLVRRADGFTWPDVPNQRPSTE
jgi:hypothetical protein